MKYKNMLYTVAVIALLAGYITGQNANQALPVATASVQHEYVIQDLYQDTSMNKLPVLTPKNITMAEAPLPVRLYYDTVSDYYDVPPSELLALTVVIYGEARGESWYGIAAVSDVVRNRVKSKMFPNNYYDVVTQHRQFSCIHNTDDLLKNVVINDDEERHKFIKIIGLAYRTIKDDMKPMTSNALFYHTNKVSPDWSHDYHRLGKIGHHIFYTTAKL